MERLTYMTRLSTMIIHDNEWAKREDMPAFTPENRKVFTDWIKKYTKLNDFDVQWLTDWCYLQLNSEYVRIHLSMYPCDRLKFEKYLDWRLMPKN